MPQLNETQLKKRGEVIGTLLETYQKRYHWLTGEEVVRLFIHDIETDPLKLRIINALSASCTIEQENPSCHTN
jgi:hypothetical protein